MTVVMMFSQEFMKGIKCFLREKDVVLKIFCALKFFSVGKSKQNKKK